ncbi:Septin-domain-containing protein, partial [Spinellus fusiger]
YSQKTTGQNRSRREPMSYLNIILVGPLGCGKTAFLRTLCESMKNNIIQGTYKESKSMALKEPLSHTQEFYSVSMHIEENGERTAFTIIDTPGFMAGYAMEHQLRYMVDYIDHQYQLTFAEEKKIKRNARALDTHIHACLYFLDGRVTTLSDLDKYVIRTLGSRVNIIPVIGKADTLSAAQRDILKKNFHKEAFDPDHLPVFGYIDVEEEDDEDTNKTYPQEKDTALCTRSPGKSPTRTGVYKSILDFLQERIDEDHDEDASAMLKYLNSMPFMLVSYEEDPETGRPVTILPSMHENGSVMNDSEEFLFSPTYTTMSPTFSVKSSRLQRSTPNGKFNKPKSILGRRYPWAVVECNNTDHCDFERLKAILLGPHKDILRSDTFEYFYENYRSNQLLNQK